MEKDVNFDAYTEERFRFSPQEVDMLMEGGRSFSLAKREVLFSAGEQNQVVYFLRKGTVKYHMLFPDGTNQTTAYSKAPSFVGVINYLPGYTSVNYCTAVTACEVSTCPIGLFEERLQQGGMQEKYLRFTLGAARHAYTNMMSLLAEDRLKLVDILRNYQKLTIQETADFMGCSRMHVSRLCKQLEERRKK